MLSRTDGQGTIPNVHRAAAGGWAGVSVPDVGLSFHYPFPLGIERVASGAGRASLYELTGSGVVMSALWLPYREADHIEDVALLDRSMADALATSGSCDALPRESLSLGIDLQKTHRCRVTTVGTLVIVYGVGFTAGSDVSDFNSILLIFGPREAVLFEHVLPLSALSPEGDAMIKQYFVDHPTMTQLWWDVPTVQDLDRALIREYDRAIAAPSAKVEQAMRTLERIARSIEWDVH